MIERAAIGWEERDRRSAEEARHFSALHDVLGHSFKHSALRKLNHAVVDLNLKWSDGAITEQQWDAGIAEIRKRLVKMFGRKAAKIEIESDPRTEFALMFDAETSATFKGAHDFGGRALVWWVADVCGN